MSAGELKNLLIQKGLEYLGRYYSLYRGSVHSNADPEQLGRLQLEVPGIYNGPSQYWAWPRGLASGKGFGFFAIPQKGDQVWVSFENGDVRFPVWEYGGWRRNETPEAARRSPPGNFVFQTPQGHRLELDDDEQRIRISHRSGGVWEINAQGIHSGQATKADYSQVLGEKLLNLLTEILDEVTRITVLTGVGESSIPVNIAAFQEIKSKLTEILSTKNTLN